jgi:hypothetical protein
MRRALLLPPLALLASGCADRLATTPASVAVPPQPYVASIDLPARADALARWQLPPDDPWAAYAKYTLLSALDERSGRTSLPDPGSLDDVLRATVAGRRVASNGLPSDTLWVVDMHGAASIAFGVAVSRDAAESVSLVPTFNNWPAENELVPATETLAALATMAPRLPQGDAATHPVFLLDSWRLAYRNEEPDDGAYDNRYILTPNDLPEVSTLRARGIRRVLYVVEKLSEGCAEEDDLHAAFADYQAAGITVAMMDLDLLEAPVGAQAWDEQVRGCILDVRPRVTIIEQPSFYARAHGAFGGINAGPSSHFGVGWHGGGG